MFARLMQSQEASFQIDLAKLNQWDNDYLYKYIHVYISTSVSKIDYNGMRF